MSVSQLYLLARVCAVTVGRISVLWRFCETPLTETPPLYYSCHRLLSGPPPPHCFSAFSPNPFKSPLFFPLSLFLSIFPNHLPLYSLLSSQIFHSNSFCAISHTSYSSYTSLPPAQTRKRTHTHTRYRNDAVFHCIYFCVILRVAQFRAEYQAYKFEKTKSLPPVAKRKRFNVRRQQEH